ncbi:unnamed protein product, partial [Discosporangium mesarthrocarpum]
LFSVSDLPRLYLLPGKILCSLAKACEGGERGEVDGLPLEDYLELSSLAMADPLTGAPLVEGGGDMDVTPANVHQFVEAVTERWLSTGLMPLAEAFRAGCSEVFPVHMLRAFLPHELQKQLCGEEPLDWTEGQLEEAVVPGAGYTRNSQPFRMFLRCLSEMSAATKHQFLLFVLGCPHLPPGGLIALTPPLEVSGVGGEHGA